MCSAKASSSQAWEPFIGMVLAKIAVSLLWQQVAKVDPPFWMSFDFDIKVFAFTLLAAAAATILAGLVPAWKSSRGDLNAALKDESRSSTSRMMRFFSASLVVFQVSLSLMLLVPAGFMLQEVRERQQISFPFDSVQVFSARIGTFETDYPEADDRIRFFESLRRNLEANPQIQFASQTSSYRFFNSYRADLRIEGIDYSNEKSIPSEHLTYVGPHYFETLNTQLLQGRGFDERDTRESTSVAIVNQSFAAKFFPNENPIGKRISLGDEISDEWISIIGIAPDLHMQGINSDEKEREAGFYLNYLQEGQRFLTILMRGEGTPAQLEKILREEVQTLDPGLPIYEPFTLAEIKHEETLGMRIFANMFLFFGLIGMLLASIGVFGVVSFAVNQRLPEMGVRMALGALKHDIYRHVFLRNIRSLILGLIIGLVGAYGFATLLANIFEGLDPTRVRVYVIVAVSLVFVALVGIMIPARKAGRVDPCKTLQSQ